VATVIRYGSSHTRYDANSAGRLVSGKPGTLGALIINNVGVGATINFYDNAAGDTSGDPIATWVTADGIATKIMGCPMHKGISMVQAGGTPADVTVVWE